ncbi:MAG: hypothetical protein E7359_02795 [Clostridiales bacterium]|nr:hypothetical protein [Clostridiales bacterium]
MYWKKIKSFKKDFLNSTEAYFFFEEWAKDKGELAWVEYDKIKKKLPIFPNLDHAQMFFSKTLKKKYLVYHPYFPAEIMKEILNQWNFDNIYNIIIYNQSWYNENTSMVVVEFDEVKL